MKNIPANKYLILDVVMRRKKGLKREVSFRERVFDHRNPYAKTHYSVGPGESRQASFVLSSASKKHDEVSKTSRNNQLLKQSINAMLLFLFTTLTLPVTYSQTTTTLTLEDAISVAAVHNLSIQQAGNNVQVSKNQASLGNAGLLPRLDLSLGSTISDASLQTAGGEVNSQTTRSSTGISAGYTLFRGMQGLNTYKLLNTQVEASELQLGLITENILYSTSQAYFNLLMTHDNLSILKEQLSVSKERLEQAIDKNDLGMSSRLQALAARVDFDSDSSSVLEAEYAFSEARRRLNLVLGWEFDRLYTPLQVDHKIDTYKLDELNKSLLTKGTRLLLSQGQETQGQLNVKNSKSSLFPSLSLSSSYGLQQINTDIDFGLGDADKTLSTGLTLSWNLFDGRKGTAIQNAKIMQKNSELNTLDSKRQGLSDLESTYTSLIKSLQVLELKQNNLSSAQLNFDQTNEYFRLGVASSTQFRESQLNLSRVKISLIQAKYSAYLDELKIWQLTGQLKARTLNG